MKLIDTKLEKFKLRVAEEKDVKIILDFIKELAIYEKLLDQVEATEESLRDSLFVRKVAEAIIGEYDGIPVGYIIFLYNFSTFLGRPGIYIEDLYVQPQMRGNGLGKIMLSYIAKLAAERNCGRVEWTCLDWNQPSIKFYKKLGAIPMDEWTIYRLNEKSLSDVAKTFDQTT